MATIREKVEAMARYAEDFREYAEDFCDSVKEKEKDTGRYIKAFYG